MSSWRADTRAEARGDDDGAVDPQVAAAGPPTPCMSSIALLSVTPYAMGIVDVDLRVIAANAPLAALTGRRPDELIGRLLSELLPPKAWAALEPDYREALVGNEVRGAEHWIDPGNGGPLTGRALDLAPIVDRGAVVAIAISVTDDPMRRRAEEALRVRTDLYAMLSRTSRAAAMSRDPQELYAELCRIAVETGHFRCAWVGVPDGDELRRVASAGDDGGYFDRVCVSLDPDDPRSQGPTGRATLGGEPAVLADFMSAAATRPWKEAARQAGLRASAAFPFKEHGQVVATLSVYASRTDIFTDELVQTLSEVMPTVSLALDAWADAEEREREELERRSLEEQLRQSQKMEAIGVLAGGVAHDFNNTLTVIRNTCALLIDDQLGADQRARVEQIDAAAESAANLTRQLLTFGRRQVVRRQPLGVDEAVSTTVELIRRLVGASIRCEVQLGAHGAQITLDRAELQQILLNLAANARDAMPEGGLLGLRTELVEVSGAQAATRLNLAHGRYVVVEVSDTGAGMDEATLNRMFEPFFTTKSMGTGLGLATVFGIVQGTGGDVSVYSEPGQGTTLRMYFPLTADAPPVPDAQPEPVGDLSGSETVLVVEDSEMLRPIVAEMLGRAGYDVLLAGDGLEAFEVAAAYEGVIDLLLTDVVMPRMNGRELAAMLSQYRPGIGVIYTSGYPADAVVQQGIAEARVAFMQKPYVGDELLRKVRAVLDRASAR